MAAERLSAEKQEIFEQLPIPKAVATMAIPTIISQVVTMIYNLADTFFIGQMQDPYMVAAISLVGPRFHLITAIANLFGMGGNSLISRKLGAGDHRECRWVSGFAIYGSMMVGIVFSLASLLFMEPLLVFLGASENTIGHAAHYMTWTVVVGSIPTLLGLVLSHLLRSEGHAKKASFGLMMGGILNLVLDPIFIFALDLGVTGAALATMLSNAASCGYFLWMFYHLRHESVMSFQPKYFRLRYTGEVFSAGLAAFLNATMASAANMVIVRLSANYSDIAVAAYGIVKKLDQFPLKASLGLCQGITPIIGYNFGAKNYRRMNDTLNFAWKLSLLFCCSFVILFEIFADPILFWFIPEAETSALGARLLRIACLAVPLHAINILLSYAIQAMGLGKKSGRLTFVRHGLLNIPLMFILDHFFGLFGMICARPLAELMILPFFALTYRKALGRIPKEQPLSP